MSKETKIQWCDYTFNPWIGCEKVSPACKFCYAEQFADRYGYAKWGPNGARQKTADSTWKKPYALDRKAKKERTRFKVFCASLADVFDDHSSINQEWRDELFKMIKETPNLDWLLLTKRPENFKKFLPADWGTGYENVWLGISVENVHYANERIIDLLETPAICRFISAEPLLGPFDLPDKGIDWIIIGGESGHITKIRKLDLAIVRQMIESAKKNGIKVFFKQLGGIASKALKITFDKSGSDFDKYPPVLDWLKIREFPAPGFILNDPGWNSADLFQEGEDNSGHPTDSPFYDNLFR